MLMTISLCKQNKNKSPSREQATWFSVKVEDKKNFSSFQEEIEISG